MPNTKFWMKKVDEWNLDSTEEAKQSLCGNCAAFDIRQDTLDCIAQGIDSDSPADAEGVIAAGDLGYCKFLKFKCASRRTCDAWVTGGPLTDNKPGVEENFADGKGPGRPGDSVRHGIPKKATMAELEKASRSAGRKGQLARWQLNMRRGKSKRRNESVAEGADDEIHNYKKLDHILATLCELVIQGHQHDPEKYGMVAACVLDPDNRVATGINLPAHDGKRQHAERVAIDKYHTEYGKIPPGSIILTTCSPCSEYMGERYGEDCTQLINSTGVKKVYCGFDDPTQSEQHREFNCTETANSQIRTLCSKFAEQFLNTGSKNPVSEAVVKKSNLKTYAARVKLKQTGYTNIVDATVMARNPEMARRLLHQLYGGNSSVVGQPREIK